MEVILIRVIIGKKIINIVLKSEMGQVFLDNIFLQMAHLLWDGGSMRHVRQLKQMYDFFLCFHT